MGALSGRRALATRILLRGACGTSGRHKYSPIGGSCCDATEELTHDMRPKRSRTKSLALDDHTLVVFASANIYSFVPRTASSNNLIPRLDQALRDP